MNAITDNSIAKSLDENTKVVKKDYVLNDMEALKKKLDNCKRDPELGIIGEAQDGSCVTVAVKTALFEYFKANLVNSLKLDTRIIDVNPTRRVTADTNFNGEANVEFQLEIKFAVEEIEHKVKVLCFSTTCNILVQNMGGKSVAKAYFRNQHCANYFATEFLLKIGTQALKSFPNMDDMFIPALKDALKKLQGAYFANKKRTVKPLAKVVKCCSLKCKSTGNLDTKNTAKYAQCTACKGFEHFHCANVKEENKLKYLNGNQEFLCSRCFAENPRSITHRNRPDITQNDTIETTALVHAVE